MPPLTTTLGELKKDPIEEDTGASSLRNVKAQSSIKNVVDVEQRYLQNYTYNSNATKISKPAVGAWFGPQNTLCSDRRSALPPSEPPPKRKAERELALEHINKRPTGRQRIPVETAADGDFEFHKRGAHRRGTSQTKRQQPSSLLSSSEDEKEVGLSPHFPNPKGTTVATQMAASESRWSGNGDSAWSTEKQAPSRGRGRALISQKGRGRPVKEHSWSLVVFQRGTTVVDEEKYSGLKIVCDNPDDPRQFVIRANTLNDTTEKGLSFQADELRDVKGCRSIRTFAVEMKHEFHIPRAGRYIRFVSKTDEDYNAIFKILYQACVDNPSEISEDRIKKFRSDLEERIGKLLPHKEPDIHGRFQGEVDDITARNLQGSEEMKRTSTRHASKPKLYDEMKKPRTIDAVVIEKSTKQKKPRATENISKHPNLRSSNGEPESSESRSIKVEKLKPPSIWKGPLLYPFEGTKRANVDYEDLERLNYQEFLNDNIINFYLRYLEERLRQTNPELSKETHFFNTFFYERLSKKSEKDPRKRIEGVLKWTSKIDLFAKNYVIIPINESSHWYLAIVCNLQHLDRKLMSSTIGLEDKMDIDSDATIPDEPKPLPKVGEKSIRTPPENHVIDIDPQHAAFLAARSGVERMEIEEEEAEWPADDENEALDPDLESKNRNIVFMPEEIKNSVPKVKKKSRGFLEPDTPAIIILDSMADQTSKRPATVRNLKNWVKAEAHRKRSIEVDIKQIHGVHPRSPNQNNWYDCGLYVLHYVEVFLDHAKDFIKSFLAKDDTETVDLWREDEVTEMRKRLFDLIIKLHGEYEEHEVRKSGGKRMSPTPVVKASSSPTSWSEHGTKPGSRATSASVEDKPPAVAKTEKTNDGASLDLQIIQGSSAVVANAKVQGSPDTRKNNAKIRSSPAKTRASPRKALLSPRPAKVQKRSTNGLGPDKMDVLEETPSSAPSSPLSDVPSSASG